MVTGSASEIGSSVCYGAARSGATVVMLDRKQNSMIPLYDKICGQGWREPIMVEYDMKKADESTIQAVAQSLSNEIVGLNGLVHCAMWGAPLTPIVHSDIKTWQTTLNLHLLIPMVMTRSLIPLLRKSDSASIIFTSTDVAATGRAYWGSIASAFAAVENLSEILSEELENINIRVNTLDPGKVKTSLRKKFYPGESGKHLRPANDIKIVDSYLYLLSDDSLGQTGQHFTIPPLFRP